MPVPRNLNKTCLPHLTNTGNVLPSNFLYKMSLLRSTLIATFLLHLFLYQSPLSNAIRSLPTTKENDDKEESLMRFSDGLPAFAEAPEYRNGAECPIPSLKDSIWSGNPSHIQIAMTIDMVYLRGTMAAILSVLKHASCPENIFFHFIAAESDSANSINYSRILRASFPSLNFKVYIFREEIVKNLISSSIRRALDNPLNYARNYLTDILDPCVQRVIYLDSDVIVVDDIQKLWNTKLTGSRIIGAPEYCHANFTRYFSDGFWSDPAASRVFEGRKPCYFNTGVMVMDLERWREGNYRSRIEGWMKLQKQRRIYQLGSLPPFLLVFAGNVEAINHRWNQHGLGGDNLEGRCRSLHPGPVSLLHWSGKGKPWVRLDARTPCLVDHLWAPYDLYIPQPQQQQPKSWISYSSL